MKLVNVRKQKNHPQNLAPGRVAAAGDVCQIHTRANQRKATVWTNKLVMGLLIGGAIGAWEG